MTSPPLVLLAHAPSARALAASIARTLARLGFAVATLPAAGQRRARMLAEADVVLLLWCGDAARAPGLRWAGKKAAAARRLTCLRTDAAIPPAPLGAMARPLPKGRGADAAWRSLLKQQRTGAALRQPTSAAPPRAAGQTSRLAGVGVLALSIAALGIALYASDARFAERVNALAGVAQAQAADIFKRGG